MTKLWSLADFFGRVTTRFHRGHRLVHDDGWRNLGMAILSISKSFGQSWCELGRRRAAVKCCSWDIQFVLGPNKK